MDCAKTGALIRALRLERGLTQRQLAEKMGLSDKTVSKWECGLGCPDVSLLSELAEHLCVNVETMLQGELAACGTEGGNMKKSRFFVCPLCGNISVCTGGAEVFCCGRKLEAMTPQKATDSQKLRAEAVEDEWYLTSDHPMTKDSYISFVAFLTGDRLEIVRQYPEWGLSARVRRRGHGMLLWYSVQDGLLYQLL